MTPMARPCPIDAMGLAARIRCPALLIMGARDRDVADPAAEARAVAASLGGPAEVVVLEGAGHYPHAQLPAETAAAVLAFLEQTVRA
jgi:pimeloyl-ACP methyl ester carboxylesterase